MMLAGAFGLAAAAKARAPSVPLWALVLAAQAIDIAFAVMLLANVEQAAPRSVAMAATGNMFSNYSVPILHAAYSHSLAVTLLAAAVAWLLARRSWGARSGIVVAAVVCAHWLLDWLLQTPVLPVLPGNAGNLPLLGLGLAQMPLFAMILETVLVLAGAFLYYRSALRLPAPSIRSSQAYRRRAFTAAIVTAGLLLLALATSLLGLA